MNGRSYPVLDLFAGYGGFTLAFESVVADAAVARRAGAKDSGAGGADARARLRGAKSERGSAFRTIGFSEIDPYASAVLAHRFPDVPNLGPVQSVTRDSVLERCGELPAVITGGFPCQPHSLAGKRGSVIDPRDLWDECIRVLRDLRPRFAIFENVAGLLTSGSYTDAADGGLGAGLFLNRVCSDLAEIRYAMQWQVVSAADVGAPHRRERVWLVCVDELAYGASRGSGECGPATLAGSLGHVDGGGAGLADRHGAGLQGRAATRHDGRDGAQPADEQPGRRGAGDRAFWPAARGLWPARPGERQHGWEPSRIVGDAERLGGDRRRPVVGEAGSTESADAGLEQTQSVVGGDVDGAADRPHAAAAQVQEAEVEFTFNDAREAVGPDNLNRFSDDELEEIAARDEGPQAQGDAVNRVNRLKALGNGIVPAVAYPFAVAIYRELLREEAE